MYNITKNSSFLLNFLIENVNIDYLNTNRETNQFLTKIYRQIAESNSYIKSQQDIKIEPCIYEYGDNKIIDENDIVFSSIPLNVKKHIRKNSKNVVHYSFNSIFNKKSINIYFITEDKLSSNSLNYYNYNALRMLSCIYVLNKYSNTKCSNIFNVYLFMTSLNKNIPSMKNIILGAENINTAYTTPCQYVGSIVLYRKEEWFKVFIHETIHSFGIDFSDSDDENINTNYINGYVLELFNVDTKLNLYETYTEFWAEVFNVIFLSYKIVNEVSDTEKINNFIYTFNFLINNERKFNIIQVVKILKYMGLTYEDLYSGKAFNKYKEGTNIMAYYILRLILLYNYNDFVVWCIKNNKNVVKFHDTYENKKSFCNFIKRNYKKKAMLEDIKKIEFMLNDDDKIGKIVNNKREELFLKNNLRMTVYD